MFANNEQRERLLGSLSMDLGHQIATHLEHPDCEDISLNEDGKLWAKLAGTGWQEIGTMKPNEALAAIMTVAKLRGLEVNHASPLLETILPTDGSRFEAILPPIVRNPIFAIRCRAKRIYGLDDYVSAGMLTVSQAQAIRESVRRRKTILVSGSTGSGKTTLLNALLLELAANAPGKVVLIEDTPELQCSVPNHNELLANNAMSMLDCLRVTMRLIPDRIIVGEVRGPEALAMLKTFNTGHPGGMATLHANNANAALLRLETLVQEAVPGYNARNLILEAINVVVHIDGPLLGERERSIRTVSMVTGFNQDHYVLQGVV